MRTVLSQSRWKIDTQSRIFQAIENADLKSLNELSQELIPHFTYRGTTPLGFAIDKKQVDVVRTLLQHNIAINYHIDSDTPLIKAIYHNNTDLVSMLLKAGAIVDIGTQDTLTTPLMVAAQQASIDIVIKLIGAGANILQKDHKGRTALHYVCKLKNYKKRENDIIQLFIDKGGDMNDPDYYNITPQMMREQTPEFREIAYGKQKASEKGALISPRKASKFKPS